MSPPPSEWHAGRRRALYLCSIRACCVRPAETSFMTTQPERFLDRLTNTHKRPGADTSSSTCYERAYYRLAQLFPVCITARKYNQPVRVAAVDGKRFLHRVRVIVSGHPPENRPPASVTRRADQKCYAAKLFSRLNTITEQILMVNVGCPSKFSKYFTRKKPSNPKTNFI